MRNNLFFPLTNYVIIRACTKFFTFSTESEELTGNKHKRQKKSVNITYMYTLMWAVAYRRLLISMFLCSK